MKTLYQLGFALIFTILITACSEDSTEITEHNSISDAPSQNKPTALPKFSDQNIETSIYELQQPGITVRTTLTSQDDKLLSEQMDSFVTYERIGAKDATDAKKILSQYSNIDYNSIDGVHHDIIYGNDSTHETIAVDFTKAELDQLIKLPVTLFSGNPNKDISYAATSKSLEKSGFKKIQ